MIWLAMPTISGDMLRGARVGVGWRVAVGTNVEFGAATTLGCPVASCIGKNGSYVGKTTEVGAAGAQEENRRDKKKADTRILFKDMDAILPVENIP